MRHQEGGKLVRPRHRRRQADRRELGRSVRSRARSSASRSPRLLEAQRMQLVEDHVFRGCRTARPRRYATASARSAPAWSAGCRAARRAGAARREGGVSPVRVSSRDRQPHLGHRHGQIARDVDGERLERRDVERVDGGCRLPLRRLRAPDRPGSAESRPASCRRRSARSAACRARRRHGRAAPTGARAGASRAP